MFILFSIIGVIVIYLFIGSLLSTLLIKRGYDVGLLSSPFDENDVDQMIGYYLTFYIWPICLILLVIVILLIGYQL